MADVTVKVNVFEMPPRAAVIVAVPMLIAVALPVASIVATVVGTELHVTNDVRSWVALSDRVPVAVNC